VQGVFPVYRLVTPVQRGDVIDISGGTVILIVERGFKGSARVSSKETTDLV
jgi:hypothetical protein